MLTFIGTAAVMMAAAFCHGTTARINVVRANYGHAPVSHSPRLRVAATRWADTNPRRHGDWISRIRAVGVTAPDLGEVIAWDFPTPRATVRAWMESPIHRRVILAPRTFLQHDGLGCHLGGGMSVVADFSGH